MWIVVIGEISRGSTTTVRGSQFWFCRIRLVNYAVWNNYDTMVYLTRASLCSSNDNNMLTKYNNTWLAAFSKNQFCLGNITLKPIIIYYNIRMIFFHNVDNDKYKRKFNYIWVYIKCCDYNFFKTKCFFSTYKIIFTMLLEPCIIKQRYLSDNVYINYTMIWNWFCRSFNKNYCS